MKTELLTKITIKEICDGFYYNESEGKGLNGWSGKLVIQPEYQRNFLYAQAKMEEAVIDSVLKKYPLGLLYFNKIADDKYEVLDGQQRITSLGRFLTDKFPLIDTNGSPHYYSKMPADQKKLIDETKLTIYVCEGKESEIKEWFKIINIGGITLKQQEISNAVYSGPFVTLAKEEFSNSNNKNIQKWSAYINGAVNRQDYLRTALEWVTKSTDTKDVEAYMSQHRQDNDINELKNYFTDVINFASTTFIDVESEMRGLEWGRLYETYHKNNYNPQDISKKVHELYADEYVKKRSGIFEYVLGGCTEPKLLEIRFFEESTKKAKYAQQTDEAKRNGVSNCPICASSGISGQISKIWPYKDMDADHVTAWSNGGKTDIKNCQMLCKSHNRAKGNK